MTDLGYGIIDRRTVVVILITLVVSSVVFGFTFPLSTTTLFDLFVDLVFFTGYVYAARTVILTPFVLRRGFRYYGKPWRWNRGKWGEIVNQDRRNDLQGFIDRLGLIGITVLSTIPLAGQTIMRVVGLVGLLLMLVIYLISGTFSFILEDSMKKAAEDQERLIEAAGRQPSSPSVIETRPHYGDRG